MVEYSGYVSLVPFLRGEIGDGFLEGRLLLNLDWPYGFSFDSGLPIAAGIVRIWAIQLLGGTSF